MRWQKLIKAYFVVAIFLAIPFIPPFGALPNFPFTFPTNLKLIGDLQTFVWALPQWKRYVVMLWFLYAGFAAYALRCRMRLFYGIIELVAAIWFVNLALSDIAGQEQNLTSDALSLGAGVYVAVRALDNIENGFGSASDYIYRRWRYYFFGDAIPQPRR